MADDSEYMTTPEASAQLGYTIQHTRVLIREGRLQGAKLGRDWLVLKESVAEYKGKSSTEPLFPEARRGRPRGSTRRTDNPRAQTPALRQRADNMEDGRD